MNIRINPARTLAVAMLSLAALGLSAGANAEHRGDTHASSGGGGGGGHSAPHGGGGGGRPSGGHGGYGGSPAMRGPVGYRGPSTIHRGFAPTQAPSGRGYSGGYTGGHAAGGYTGGHSGGYTGGSSGRGYAGGANTGRGYVDHRVYNPVHGRGGWGQPGGWYGHRPYWSFVGVLPWYYTTMWWNGVPYYYADSSYYLWNDSAAQYQVVPPPANADESVAPQEAAQAADFYVYPNNGQSAEQQSTDRYECHRWAVDQTGFDPTRPNGGVAPETAGEAGDAYHRAEGACLQGRAYTVK